VARAVREQRLEWAELESPQVRVLIAEVLAVTVPRLQNGALLDSERMRQLHRKLENLLHETVMLVVEHAQRGAFRPVEIEASFGPGAARLPALEFDLPGEARLVIRGRIDRIDVARLPDGREALRVVDYKSRQQDLKLERVYHGLSLQLGVYFLAALRGWSSRSPSREVHPGGLLYFPVHDPIIAVDRPQDETKSRVLRRKQTRTNGWVSDDQAVVEGMDRDVSGELIPVTRNKDGGFSARSRLLEQRHVQALFVHLEETVIRLGAEILAGNVAISPYRIGAETACATCDFGGLCGFEEGGPGSDYRTLEKLKAPDVWTRLLPVALEDASTRPQEALTP
jgi:ATP-dependent helicase/nuclease subunit B